MHLARSYLPRPLLKLTDCSGSLLTHNNIGIVSSYDDPSHIKSFPHRSSLKTFSFFRFYSVHYGINNQSESPHNAPTNTQPDGSNKSRNSINTPMIKKINQNTVLVEPSSASNLFGDSNIFFQQDEFTVLQSLLFRRNQTVSFVKDMSEIRKKRDKQKITSDISKSKIQKLDFSRFVLPGTSKSEANYDNLIKRQEKFEKYVSSATRDLESSEVIGFFQVHMDIFNSLGNPEIYIILEKIILRSNEHSFFALFRAIESLFFNSKEFIDFSNQFGEKLVIALMTKALDIFPKTNYLIEDGEVAEFIGYANLTHFEGLILKLNSQNNAHLKDLYFNLMSRSGSLIESDKLLEKYSHTDIAVSEDSLDSFFEKVGKFLIANRKVSHLTRLEYNNSIKDILQKYESYLISENITPALAELLLEFSSYLEEFHGLLNIIEESKHKDKIFSHCQPKILQAAVRCSLPFSYWTRLDSESGNLTNDNEYKNNLHVMGSENPMIRKQQIYSKAMATMFGILNRFVTTNFGITVEALDQCLIISARLGNSAGMYKALSLRLQKNTTDGRIEEDFLPISSYTLIQVFNSFPISQSGLNKEKLASSSLWVVNDAIIADATRDETILFHLRSHIDPIENTNVYIQYLAALGRCRRVDLLSHEWNSVLSKMLIHDSYLENPHFQDIIMTLLAAFKTANSTENALNILNLLLEASTISDSSHGYSLNILVKVISHELLPLASALNHLARWLILNRASPYWSDADVIRIFGEISAHGTLPPDMGVSFNETNEQKGASSSIMGKLLSKLVIEVRHGNDIEVTLKHLEHKFGRG